MILLHSDLVNLDTVKTELIRYYDSGTYIKQITAVDLQAENYLSYRVNENSHLTHPKKLAIVLDIDETSLSNYPDMAKMSFGGTDNQISNAISKAKDPVIKPTLDLFKLAAKDHVAVFFVTGREEELRSPTVKNLDAAGYFQYNGLMMRPNNYKNPSVVPYKTSARKSIEARGYDIVLNLGDQLSDLEGGYADKTYKLPDPFYYIA